MDNRSKIKRKNLFRVAGSLLLITFFIPGFGLAGAGNLKPGEQLFQMHPVSDFELDENRGGFVTSNGIRVDFSFDKSTFVNGIKQAQTVLNFDGNNIDLRSGTGNPLNAGLLPTSINVINNFLPNQVIQDISTLNIRFSNFGVVQRSRLQALDFSTFPGTR